MSLTTYEPGEYEVDWESKNSAAKIIDKVTIDQVKTHEEFIKFLSIFLPNFDKLYGNENNTIRMICPLYDVGVDTIIMIHYKNQREINRIINSGYCIREFFQDVCILEKIESTTIN